MLRVVALSAVAALGGKGAHLQETERLSGSDDVRNPNQLRALKLAVFVVSVFPSLASGITLLVTDDRRFLETVSDFFAFSLLLVGLHFVLAAEHPTPWGIWGARAHVLVAILLHQILYAAYVLSTSREVLPAVIELVVAGFVPFVFVGVEDVFMCHGFLAKKLGAEVAEAKTNLAFAECVGTAFPIVFFTMESVACTLSLDPQLDRDSYDWDCRAVSRSSRALSDTLLLFIFMKYGLFESGLVSLRKLMRFELEGYLYVSIVGLVVCLSSALLLAATGQKGFRSPLTDVMWIVFVSGLLVVFFSLSIGLPLRRQRRQYEEAAAAALV